MFAAANIMADSNLPVYQAAGNWNTASAIHSVDDVRALAALLYASHSVAEKAPNSNVEDRAYGAMELSQCFLYDTNPLNRAVLNMILSSNTDIDAAAIERQLLHNMPDGFTLAEAIVK